MLKIWEMFLSWSRNAPRGKPQETEKIKQEARQLVLPGYTYKQNVYARNSNSFSQDPVQKKSSNEFKSSPPE